LRRVVIVGVAEAEQGSGIEVVEIVNGADLFERFQRVNFGRLLVPQADAIPETLEESPFVEDVTGLSQGHGTSLQVDRGGHGAHRRH
jgi:hypothetical protein